MARKRANGEGSISKRKNGTWEARLFINGKRHTMYAPTQREAKARLE